MLVCKWLLLSASASSPWWNSFWWCDCLCDWPNLGAIIYYLIDDQCDQCHWPVWLSGVIHFTLHGHPRPHKTGSVFTCSQYTCIGECLLSFRFCLIAWLFYFLFSNTHASCHINYSKCTMHSPKLCFSKKHMLIFYWDTAHLYIFVCNLGYLSR